MREYEVFAELVKKRRGLYFYLPVPEAVIRDVWNMGEREEKRYFLLFFAFSLLLILSLKLEPFGIITIAVIAFTLLIPKARNAFIVKPVLVRMKRMYCLTDGRIARIEAERSLSYHVIHFLSFIMLLVVLYFTGTFSLLVENLKSVLGAIP